MSIHNPIAYICGPLTELPKKMQDWARRFYESIADVCEEVSGDRAFVPHEHYCPIMAPNFSPAQIDLAERRQVCQSTTVLIVIAIAPSWGGGIEVEMANKAGVPAIILHPKGKKVSRLLRGNPAIVDIIEYKDEEDALSQLKKILSKIFCLSS